MSTDSPKVALDRQRVDAGAGMGLRMLQGQLAQGLEPDARMFLATITGCAKNKGFWREALQITAMLEVWVRRKRSRAGLEDVSRAFASAIAACDESGQKEAALALLPRMDALAVPPRVEAFNAAISSCRHSGADVELAQELFAQIRYAKLQPTVASMGT